LYLFDTDTISNLMKRVPSTRLLDRLASAQPEEQFTSSVTVGEIVYGAYRAQPRTGEHLRRLERALSRQITVVPFDEESAYRYGELRADLERRGTPIGDGDTRIASIALARGLTVVTGNVRHFQMVPGLAVENWLA
jgi:predicted nucleic acid-binding protein